MSSTEITVSFMDRDSTRTGSGRGTRQEAPGHDEAVDLTLRPHRWIGRDGRSRRGEPPRRMLRHTTSEGNATGTQGARVESNAGRKEPTVNDTGGVAAAAMCDACSIIGHAVGPSRDIPRSSVVPGGGGHFGADDMTGKAAPSLHVAQHCPSSRCIARRALFLRPSTIAAARRSSTPMEGPWPVARKAEVS